MFMNQEATTELEYIDNQKARAEKIATQCNNLIASLTLFQTAVEKYNAELRACLSQKELLQRHSRFNFSNLDDEDEYKVTRFFLRFPAVSLPQLIFYFRHGLSFTTSLAPIRTSVGTLPHIASKKAVHSLMTAESWGKRTPKR